MKNNVLETVEKSFRPEFINRLDQIIVFRPLSKEVIRMIVPRWLKRMGCFVATSADGRETIDMYRKSLSTGEPFDILILDLTIPGGIGGLEVVKEILAIDPKTKAIVSSGYANDPVMSNYAFYGFKGVLPKPYTESQLQEFVGQIAHH